MPTVPKQENASDADIRPAPAAHQRWTLGSLRPERRAGMLQMNVPILVQIIGAPIACNDGVRDSWRAVAGWAATQLKTRFGAEVCVRYYDLFDADCPPIPAGAQLPLVLVNGEVLSNGGKISVPSIRKQVDALKAGAPE
ncbi:MAG TPA: hypothetical protein VLE49_00045 [Anaerolineales bacterium]|nr:hypothetical protein [Anaerolineales bacterium]